MGARKSIHAGEAKIDFNVDPTQMLCYSLCLPPSFTNSTNPLSHLIARLSVKHDDLFGRNEKLDLSWDKGLQDSNIRIAFRRPRFQLLNQYSFDIQHSVTPEIAVHGLPINSFSNSGSGGINLCCISVGVNHSEPTTGANLSEPTTSKWSTMTSIKFEHVRLVNDEGISICQDLDGFPLTCSGSSHDNMVILKHQSRYATSDDDDSSSLNFQIEQGLPLLSKCLIFNRFKFDASKGVKIGRALLVSSLTGGSIVGDMAPHQAFTVGGLRSVRGYGEGAVGSGRSCLVASSELTVPLPMGMEGAIFMDCGTDLGSARHVPGNPALRQGKPGFGIGFGYGLRVNSQFGELRVDCAINGFQRKTIYFGVK